MRRHPAGGRSGAGYVYIHFFAGSAGQAEASQGGDGGGGGTTSSVPAATAPLAGVWKVGSGSTAGYRADEVLFGQTTTAVGRTSDVTGSMTIAGNGHHLQLHRRHDHHHQQQVAA